MCDVVEQFACPGRLDGACGTVDDIVRTAGEKPSVHRAVRGGCEGGGCLVAERPRCGERGVGYGHGPAFARRSHTEHRLDLRIPVELRDKRFEELTHGRMLARKLLAVGKAEPCATTAAVHDGARGPGVGALGGGFLGPSLGVFCSLWYPSCERTAWRVRPNYISPIWAIGGAPL